MELTQLGLVLIVFSFIPYATNRFRHVSIEVLVQRFKKNARVYVTAIGDFTCVLVFLVICRQSFIEGLQARMFCTSTSELEIPIYPFYYYVAFGALLSGISLFITTIDSLLKKDKEQP